MYKTGLKWLQEDHTTVRLKWNPWAKVYSIGYCPSHHCLESHRDHLTHQLVAASSIILFAVSILGSTWHFHEYLLCSWCSSVPRVPNPFPKKSTNYFYVFVFLEEGIVCVATLVFTVKLHIVKTIRIMARICKKSSHHSPAYLFSKLILLFVEELHLLLFSDLLKLSPTKTTSSG